MRKIGLMLLLIFSCALLPSLPAAPLTPEEREQLRLERQLKLQQENKLPAAAPEEAGESRGLLIKMKENRQRILTLQKTVQQKTKAVKGRTSALQSRPDTLASLDRAALKEQLQKVASNRQQLETNLQALRGSVVELESLRSNGQRKEMLAVAQATVQLQRERIRLLITGNQELDRLLSLLQGPR